MTVGPSSKIKAMLESLLMRSDISFKNMQIFIIPTHEICICFYVGLQMITVEARCVGIVDRPSTDFPVKIHF
jgi:hypothetical protein